MTNRKELLVDREHLYALTTDQDGRLFLEVTTGSIGWENLVVPLNQEEVQCYSKQGKPYLDSLALRVSKTPSAFSDRTI
jgi:hypothetical protein